MFPTGIDVDAKMLTRVWKSSSRRIVSPLMPTALVLLYLSAAFDTIDHDTLLTCLSIRFGFTGTVLRWFTTYLLDQSVKIGSVITECFKLNFGVPQGSVLGPLLFSHYTSPP